LKAGDQDRLLTAETKTLESYQLYVKGRELLHRRGGVISRAAQCFEREVALDPDYALAWAGLAASLAEAHNALAMASLMCAWDGPTAEREFLNAIELNPSYTQARDWYALFYLQFSEGRLADGMEQAKLALRADPLSSYAHAVYGLTCGNAGKKDEAVKACQRAVELDSDSYLAQMLLQLVLHIDGKLEESVEAGESALAMSG
jgi:adenylate cyclase